MNTIVTFYSYKGGVGRTMALANIAILLAQKGLNILAVDWDLEAPGLDRYFHQFTRHPRDRNTGLLDLLRDAAASFPERKPDWRDYIVKLDIPEALHPLTLLRSGRYDEEYAAKVLTFDWQDFFARRDGDTFLESLRKQWREEFHVTLIDSRTGFTDSGGICTIQMPDILVLVFSANEQSLLGAKDIAERAQRARQKLPHDRMPLLVFPLPSRFDMVTEFAKGQEWLNKFAEQLKPFYEDWLPSRYPLSQVLEKTKLPYVPYFSFGEPLPVISPGTSDPQSLGYAYVIAATLIAEEFKGVGRLLSGGAITHLEALRWRESNDWLLTAKATKALGDMYLHLGEDAREDERSQEYYDTARQQYEQAHRAFQALGDITGRAECSQLIGTAYLRLADYEQAEEWYQSALQLYKAVGDKWGQADCIKSLGDRYFTVADYYRAKEQYQDAFKIYEESSHKSGAADCLRALGDVCRRLSNYKAAREQYDEALNRYEEVSNKFGKAQCILESGHLHMAQSAYTRAIAQYQLALYLYLELGDKLWEATSIKSLGDAYRRLGRLDDAREQYKSALCIYKKIVNKPGIADCQQALGHLHMRLAEYTEAQKLYDGAFRLYRQIRDKQGRADCGKSLGDVFWHQGQHAVAEQKYLEVLTIYKQIGVEEGQANCLKSLGDMYKARPEDEEDKYGHAIEWYDQALSLYKKIQDNRRMANCHKDMGDAAVGLSDLDTAWDHYKKAMSLYEQVQAKEETANCLRAMGELHRKRGETEAARSQYQRALGLYREIGKTGAANDCQEVLLQLYNS